MCWLGAWEQENPGIRHAGWLQHDLACSGAAAGRPLDTLPHLVTEGPFDLIFIDADKAGYPDYFLWAMKLSRRGSVIIADNVVREGAVIEAGSDDADVHGIRRFYELLAADPRVSATAIQTVGRQRLRWLCHGARDCVSSIGRPRRLQHRRRLLAQQLCDLHRVEGCPLQELVAGNEHGN